MSGGGRVTLDALMDVCARASVGDLDARVTVVDAPEDDPLTVMGVALNVLLDDLAFRNAEREAALRQLRETNATLEARVAERTASLAAANRELEAFAYTVAHDLRAPLRVIHALAEITLEDHEAKLPAEARSNLDVMRTGARRMGDLIQTLLTFARTAQEPVQVSRGVDVTAIAREVAAGLAAESPGRHVETRIQEGMVADADPGLLRVALQNLLANAWKYTGRTPRPLVEVGTEGTAAAPVFFVRDNGVGFDPAKAERLFRPFERLHATGEFGGTGVGLATVARVVERHGGRVWGEGKPGEGATFRFTLAPAR